MIKQKDCICNVSGSEAYGWHLLPNEYKNFEICSEECFKYLIDYLNHEC